MDRTRKLIYAALFLALGITLPLLTMQIKEIGDSLLPMHLAVLLCGFLCGENFGLLVGAVLPFLRSVLFGMPPIYPNAVWMAAELAAYGFLSGFLFRRFFHRQIWWIYGSLVLSMLGGRIVWGIAKTLLLTAAGKKFLFSAFIAGGFVDAFPGIVLQLILIPIIVRIFYRKGR